MYWAYGSFVHPANEVNLVNFQQFPVYTERLRRRTTRYRATIEGELQYSTQADLTTRIGNLIDGYSVDGQEACLYQDDGTPTRHRLALTANLISGPRIMYRDWPKGDAAEYATKRTFRVILEAEYLEADSEIVSFQETLSFRGNGGPIWTADVCATGPPRATLRAQRSVQHVLQQGTIVGLTGHPTSMVPGPIFGPYEHGNMRTVRLQSPRFYGSMYLDFPISYSYSFSLPAAQNAIPTII